MAQIASEDKPLHALDRLGLGPRPGDLDRLRAAGVEGWIEAQLHPETLPAPAELRARLDALATLRMTPAALFEEYGRPEIEARGDQEARKAARLRARLVLAQAAEARVARALEAPAQLQEATAAFWFNHFNVFADKGLDHLWTGAFEEQAIRPNALGRFRDLLGATARHPAMLFYLDNWQNTGPDSPGRRGRFEGLNENYARELMELHTLGVDGGYTQPDVVALARILTGWGLRPPRSGRGRRGGADDGSGFYFDPRRHDAGDKVFLGRPIRAAGVAEGEHALDVLARSPATARFVAGKLARYFVADEPPAPLVARLAARFLETDGDIRAVLAALFASPEFWDEQAYRAKFKTPYEYVLSAVRATGVPVQNVRPLLGAMALLGMPLHGCPTPNGYKDTQQAWLNPDAMMLRLSFATGLGAGRLPLDRPPVDEAGPARGMAAAPRGAGGGHMAPPDPDRLAATLGTRFAPETAAAVKAAPAGLRAALLLGSREFMTR